MRYVYGGTNNSIMLMSSRLSAAKSGRTSTRSGTMQAAYGRLEKPLLELFWL
jgi:hypothetical protein